MSSIQLPELTKKNQEFIHIVTHQLIQDGKSDEEIKALLAEILPAILEHQKKGITARGLYGAPSEWAKAQSQTADSNSAVDTTNDNPWLMWLDASLLILTILGLGNGLLNFFQSGSQYGFITLLVIGFGVGTGLYLMYHFVYRHMGNDTSSRPRFLQATLFMMLTTLIWAVIFFLAAQIPSPINPILSPLATILLGGIAFGIRYLLKKKYNIRNAMQAVR